MEDDPTDDATSSRTTSRRRYLAGAAAATAAVAVPTVGALAGGDSGEEREFRVRIENVSDGSTLQTTADGEAAEQPVPLSPGAYAVHSPDEPIFSKDEPARGNGLQDVAEDGKPGTLVESLSGRDAVVDAGAFKTPVGADGPGPLKPGDAYEFSVAAAPGKPTPYLSLVTMFVPSNDLFYALGGPSGLPLFDGDAPASGNVTDRAMLWDAGTEVNEEPGVGDNQVQRQRGRNVGLVERGTVAPVAEIRGYDYPDCGDVLKVMVTQQGGN